MQSIKEQMSAQKKLFKFTKNDQILAQIKVGFVQINTKCLAVISCSMWEYVSTLILFWSKQYDTHALNSGWLDKPLEQTLIKHEIQPPKQFDHTGEFESKLEIRIRNIGQPFIKSKTITIQGQIQQYGWYGFGRTTF